MSGRLLHWLRRRPGGASERPPFRRSRVALWVSVSLLGALVVSAPGVAWSYDRSRSDVLPSGARIGDVEVGGLDLAGAVEAARHSLEAPLHRPLRVSAPGFEQQPTPWELGLRIDVQELAESVLREHRGRGLLKRLFDDLTGSGPKVDASPTLDERQLEAAAVGFAEAVARPPRNAGVELVNGWLRLNRSQRGVALEPGAAADTLRGALEEGATEIELPVATAEPEVPTARYHRMILIRTLENRLYLYEDGRIVREYPVATGMRGHSTPSAQWDISRKRLNPSWGNPGSAWARNMPRYIGPGPNNPLGTRALNLGGSLLRIHGTPDRGSIGRHASRGCIRMLREHVEELFELVEVGTRVVITRA